MIAIDPAHTARYEYKYVISESLAEAARGVVQSYLVPDHHMHRSPSPGYAVHSLYLDGPKLPLYSQSTEGLKNRFKLRIRFYDESATSQAFLEIKRRIGAVVVKQRASVAKSVAQHVLRGGRPTVSQLIAPNERSAQVVHDFCDHRDHLDAVAKLLVSYQREAYTSPGGQKVRITFDRVPLARPYHLQPGLHMTDQDMLDLGIDGVVMELKFCDKAPPWAHQLVQSLGLRRQSVAKYVHGVDAVGADKLV